MDAHEKPPDYLRALYKKYQKLPLDALDDNTVITDFSTGRAGCVERGLFVARPRLCCPSRVQFPSSAAFLSVDGLSNVVLAYEHVTLPGFFVIPSLLSKTTQWEVLSKLLHRDLANEKHKTNVHTHYEIPYELSRSRKPDTAIQDSDPDVSFFRNPPGSKATLKPINHLMHHPMTIEKFLRKKLRWITLGGQYDWTTKTYSEEQAPEFPPDLAQLVQGFFPEMKPEAAIVNVYTPGDTLSLHRDVSEDSDQGLVSISLGCDGIFIVGLENDDRADKYAVVRLRSGDAVYMSGAARYAWHGVPSIIPNTCPDYLSTWPALPKDLELSDLEGRLPRNYESWRGWMSTKRINLNVRQMRP